MLAIVASERGRILEKEDHLDKETSVSAEITPTGVKASARSRAISAFDRLIGNVFERWNAPMEAKTAEIRAVSESRQKVIDALTSMGLDKLRNDPEAAARAIENHFGKVFERQDNKEAVVSAAAEDLRQQPPTDEQATSGDERLQGPFIDRLERYAEEASTGALREKWGRVLAAEIRKPGTFSARVMRVVDELDPKTAQIFERVCVSRIHNTLPKSTVGELEYGEIVKLTEAGLLVEPGLGQFMRFKDAKDGNGVDLFFCYLGSFGVAFPNIDTIKWADSVLQKHGDGPALPVYILTDVGFAISSILPDTEYQALVRLVSRIGESIDPSVIRKYVEGSNPGSYVMVT
jgi:hypothetical protein